jgi:hypothetical protein
MSPKGSRDLVPGSERLRRARRAARIWRENSGRKSQRIADLSERLKEVERQREEAEKKKEFTQQWYAERIRRITDTAKREGIWEEIACILANGTGDVYEPPTYAQILNSARCRAKKAEAALADRDRQVRELVEGLRKEAGRAVADKNYERKNGVVFARERIEEQLLTQPSSNPPQQGREDENSSGVELEEGKRYRIDHRLGAELTEARTEGTVTKIHRDGDRIVLYDIEYEPELVRRLTPSQLLKVTPLTQPEADPEAEGHDFELITRADVIAAALDQCRRIEADAEPRIEQGLPNDIARAQGEHNAAELVRELLEHAGKADPEVPRCGGSGEIRYPGAEALDSRRQCPGCPDCQPTPELLGEEGGFEHCKRCGRGNTLWFAPSPLWNAVMRGGSIEGDPIYGDLVCATCFMTLAEERGIADGFKVYATRVHVELETVTPSGRVWDEERGLWTDPASTQPVSESPGDSGEGLDGLERWMLDAELGDCEPIEAMLLPKGPTADLPENGSELVRLRDVQALLLTQPVPGNSGGVEEGHWEIRGSDQEKSASIWRHRRDYAIATVGLRLVWFFRDEGEPCTVEEAKAEATEIIDAAQASPNVAQEQDGVSVTYVAAASTQPPSPQAEVQDCERCGGNGAISEENVRGFVQCPDCNGTGKQPPAEPQGDAVEVRLRELIDAVAGAWHVICDGTPDEVAPVRAALFNARLALDTPAPSEDSNA